MNSKNIIGSIITAWILASCGTPNKKNQHIKDIHTDSIHQQITKKELSDTLSHTKKNTLTVQPDVMLFDIQEMIKKKDAAITIADGKSLLWMLGSLDVDNIIKQYNPQLASTQKEWYNRSRQDIRSLDTLYVPRIFPSMKEFFSPQLDTFLVHNPQIKDSVEDDQTVIIVTELPNWHFWLWFYENGILQLAYPVSIWDWWRHRDKVQERKTKSRKKIRYQWRSPQWRFWVKRKHANKKSKANDSMAYFLELIWERWLWLHGQKTQSKRQSHWCFRQPQLAAKMLFERVVADSTDWTPFVSYWNPNKIELDSAKYYTEIHPELKEAWLKKQDTIKKNTQKDTIKTLLWKKD